MVEELNKQCHPTGKRQNLDSNSAFASEPSSILLSMPTPCVLMSLYLNMEAKQWCGEELSAPQLVLCVATANCVRPDQSIMKTVFACIQERVSVPCIPTAWICAVNSLKRSACLWGWIVFSVFAVPITCLILSVFLGISECKIGVWLTLVLFIWVMPYSRYEGFENPDLQNRKIIQFRYIREGSHPVHKAASQNRALWLEFI